MDILKTGLLLLLTILIGLILYSFLGGTKEGFTTSDYTDLEFYGPNGSTATITNSSKIFSINIDDPVDSSTNVIFNSSPQSAATISNITDTTFYVSSGTTGYYANSIANFLLAPTFSGVVCVIIVTLSSGDELVFESDYMTNSDASTNWYNWGMDNSANWNEWKTSASANWDEWKTDNSANWNNWKMDNSANWNNWKTNYESSDYDNYDHYSRTSSPTTYYGQNGGTAKLMNNNGVYSIVITSSSGQTTAYMLNSKTGQTYSSNNISQFTNSTFYGPNGATATVFSNTGGQYAIKITMNGTTTIYTPNNAYTFNNANTNQYSDTNTNSNYYGKQSTWQNGASAGYIRGPNGGSAGYAQGPYGGTAAYAQGPNGNTAVYTQGIPASQIPQGQQDLYILKSEIVPPVCPACPACINNSSGSSDKPPPCPACARCPESSFECKKVPNYDTMNKNNIPHAILHNYSTFGT